MSRASSNMRLITGRALRKFVLLKGIEAEAVGLRRMEIANRLAALKAAVCKGRACRNC
jgi:hypothetical protein